MSGAPVVGGYAGIRVRRMGSFGSGELIIVLVIVLLVFGGSQLPKLAKNLGKAQKEFKDGLAEGQADKAAEKPERDVEAELAAARAEAAELRAQAAARAETPPPTTAAPATPPSPSE